MNKKKKLLLIAVLLMLCVLPASRISAAGVQPKNNPKKNAQAKKNSPGWHTKANGKKYYIRKNGKKATGWTKIKGRYYYFKANGILNTKNGWVQINGKTYYILENGSRREPGFLQVNENTYYIRANGSRCESGLCKIDGNYYYFDKEGKLVTGKRPFVLEKQYYNIDSKGIVEHISTLEAQCEIEAQEFIKKHSKSSMSEQEKLRACFKYLLAYMRYRPQAPDWSEFKVKEWYYQKAIKTFRSPSLDGNCYSFACTVAACAKELGYKPTVIVITADHGFVMIDGKYYDNMKGGLFASAVPSCPGYKVYTKAEF